MLNDANDNNGNQGNRSKFTDRLVKMRRDRMKKSKNIDELDSVKDENMVVRGSRNILKIILALPSVVYTNVKSDNKKTTNLFDDDIAFSKESITNCSDNYLQYNTNISIQQREQIRNEKVNKIREMNITLLKKKKELYLIDKQKNDDCKKIIEQINDKEFRIIKLQKEIIDLIKKRLVKNINELEILNSELYLLKELNGEDIYLKDCQDNIKEIKKMLSKIKSLKEKYDYLKDNVDFEYMLEYGDDLLIDKILELKSLCSDDDIKYTVDNYKILDEYKFLYLKIDKLQEDVIKYEEYKNTKADELKQRDIDFDKLKNEVYDVDKENNKYSKFVEEQELFLKKLEEKLLRIDSHEEITYRLKGFNQLLGNSFKYLGLLLMHPLKAFIPGIATHTIVTKNIIRNLYNNLEWEENKKMVYEAIDYSTEINHTINNLDFTSSLIDSTLEDIARLKVKYKNDFSQYEYSFSGYRDAIKKINKMENAILGSKIKIMNIQQRMKEKERENKNKLKMVKKLTTSNNS